MNAPTLQTARLTLGPATPDHAEAFVAFCATDASRFIGGPAERRDAWEGAAIMAGRWALRGYGPFWLSTAGVPVGRVGIFYPDRLAEPELSWVIYPAFQAQGHATEAALAARDRAGAVLGLGQSVSLIDASNAPSIRVAQKMRAVLEGPHEPNSGHPVMRWRHLAGTGSGQA